MRDHLTRWLQPMLDHRAAADAVAANCTTQFEAVLEVWLKGLRAGGKLIFFGNGGSAAMAQHFAAECVVRLKKDRKPIAAIDLTAGAAILTAAVNDIGAEFVFMRHMEAVAKPEDIVVALSTSGRSRNVEAAVTRAIMLGMQCTALLGPEHGYMPRFPATILVPSGDTARIQEMHLMLGHMLIAAVEKELDLV